MDETFCFENDNVVLRCLWHKKKSEQNHPLLRGDDFCACHMVSDYCYEKSAEYLKEQANRKKDERKHEKSCKSAVLSEGTMPDGLF